MGTFLRKNSPIELVVKKRPKIPAAAPQVASVGALKHRKILYYKKIRETILSRKGPSLYYVGHMGGQWRI